MTTEDTQESATLFSLVGGASTVDRLVEAFYRNMDETPAARDIRAMHAAELGPTKAILKSYLSEWLGGPKDYSSKRGHPRLRMRHARFSIGPAGRDAWLLCMNAALEECIEDPAARASIGKQLAGLADWMRNDPDNAHDKAHRG
ncbi:group II truncated hemoglobin [Methylocystis parvus]|uniref:Group II truncated hemoglobin n=1 Tax=Methylocystis parvus TaxID=134 RepID=A0A6B8M6H2_9HYPH|nr:group II truncated hemoglobin [Methylocystis parvus]QGM98501.1 group II truncated hemoglobin [Methylocystis parvus]WBK01159.1 group II truncated hemoglobin [Methylocystis parvus OBBP]